MDNYKERNLTTECAEEHGGHRNKIGLLTKTLPLAANSVSSVVFFLNFVKLREKFR
jgi:hypothetical protein